MALDFDLLAEALPRYEIRREIGRGGWGVVFEGWHRDLQRSVAIKQLPRAFGADPSVRDRFIAEAQLVAGLQHPHIVPVYDFVERDGLYIIVMELAGGGTLWQRFSDLGLETDEAVAAVLATAVGLHHAHCRKLLHRDVKPDNILYTGSGTVKIADFGIAKAMGETKAGRTATGSVIGTPAYMAPEQVTGGELSAGTDVYALGVVLYELLSGQLPFPDVPDGIAQLFQHVHETPRTITDLRPEVPSPLAAVVHRALSKAPVDRPHTAEEFAVELANAATASFGPGWLARSGIEVMGSTSVIAATERASAEVGRRAGTVLVKPEHAERLRLGELQSAVPSSPTDPNVTVAPPGVGASSHATVAPAGQAASATLPEPAVDATTPSPAVESFSKSEIDRGSPAETKQRHLLPWLAGLGAVALLVVLAFVMFSGGGSGDPSLDTADREVDPVADISSSEETTFRNMCDANGVNEPRCECALERAVDQLEPAVFRRGLAAMLERDGLLSAELTEIFQDCVDDGF